MLGAQVGGFLGAGAGVVEEQDQRAVPQREPAVAGQVAQEVFDLVAFEEPGFRRGGALGRDGRDLLAGGEHLRCASGDVVEQAVQGGQPLVAGAGVVAAVVLEVAQERHDPVEGEVGERQPGDLAALVGRDEHQEQPDGVAVAAHRGGAQAFDRDQVAGEEGVQERAERLGAGSSCRLGPGGLGEGLEPPVGLVQQLRGDRQVDRGRARVDVAHEGRELVQPGRGVEPLPIPAQQAADREGVSQAVQPSAARPRRGPAGPRRPPGGGTSGWRCRDGPVFARRR